MKVLKFGGTSVGTANNILSVKQIVESNDEQVIVVVSALGGITDKLIATSRMAAAGDTAYEQGMQEIIRRHYDMVHTVIPVGSTRENLWIRILELLEELQHIYQQVFQSRTLSSEMSAVIVSFGERMSSLIASNLIEGAGWFDSLSFIKTERNHHKDVLAADLTEQLIRKTFQDLPHVSLVPGFISTDAHTGEITNLGRGGSDFTAAILAAALHADCLEIWTDVDGFLTADPRVIKTACLIDEMSYTEAEELCNYGAKVIYPPTIYPVRNKNIPIYIKNTMNPESVGTIIKQNVSDTSRSIKGISSVNDTCLITMVGTAVAEESNIEERIQQCLSAKRIHVMLVSQPSSNDSITINVRREELTLAEEILKVEFAAELSFGTIRPLQLTDGLSTVAIVGEDMKQIPDVVCNLFSVLEGNDIHLLAHTLGESDITVVSVVEAGSLQKTLSAVHDAFLQPTMEALKASDCTFRTMRERLNRRIPA